MSDSSSGVGALIVLGIVVGILMGIAYLVELARQGIVIGIEHLTYGLNYVLDSIARLFIPR